MVLTMTITMKAWFRTLAAAFKSPAPAQSVAGLAILVLVLYTGYAIPQPSMIGALRWITYINVRPFSFHIFALVNFVDAFLLASTVRFRGDSGQRVPHFGWTVCHPCSVGPWLRRRIYHKPSVYGSSLRSWSSDGKRQSIHCSFVWLFLWSLVEGKFIFSFPFTRCLMFAS